MKLRVAAVAACLLALLSAAVGEVTFEATNTVPDTAGGQRFDEDIGEDYAEEILSDASTFTWDTFKQHRDADRAPYDAVTLVVDDYAGVAYTRGNSIHLGQQYVADYSGDVETEVIGVLYHEVTHVWQWGLQDYQAHSGVFEGIADFVRLRAGYAPAHWVKPGQGDRWDQGYDVTARFFDYCDSLKPGFVALLNAKLKDGYREAYFTQILGKDVQQLWRDYKAKYGG